MKPFLSDIIGSKEQILLVENDEKFSEDSKIAESLNSFFSNLVKNRKIPGFKPHNDSLFENVSDPILKVILKYKPSKHTHYRRSMQKQIKQAAFIYPFLQLGMKY